MRHTSGTRASSLHSRAIMRSCRASAAGSFASRRASNLEHAEPRFLRRRREQRAPPESGRTARDDDRALRLHGLARRRDGRRRQRERIERRRGVREANDARELGIERGVAVEPGEEAAGDRPGLAALVHLRATAVAALDQAEAAEGSPRPEGREPGVGEPAHVVDRRIDDAVTIEGTGQSPGVGVEPDGREEPHDPLLLLGQTQLAKQERGRAPGWRQLAARDLGPSCHDLLHEAPMRVGGLASLAQP